MSAGGFATEFGAALTPHMVVATWSEHEGWSAPVVTERGPLPLDASAVGLHYGQIVFEGLKAYRRADGVIALFRPHAYAQRMRNSAARMAMTQPPEELFIESLALLVRKDGDALPDDPAVSLYLRPILIASEPVLALRPSRQYVFAVMAFVTAAFFDGRTDPVTVWVSTDYVRAAPGGSGSAKAPGNYAPAYLAQADAARHGCHQVVWLDAVERRWVEEMGGMNLFFVHDEGDGITVSTPPLAGTILAGVTRDSLLVLGSALGYRMVERPISLGEWRDGSARGSITETIACGTAATVTAVGRVRTVNGDWLIGGGTEGPLAVELRRALRDIQHGSAPDPWGWSCPVV